MKDWEYGYDSFSTAVTDPAAKEKVVRLHANTTDQIVLDEAGVDALIKRLLSVQRLWKKR